MRLISETGGRTLARSDSPWLGPHALMWRPSAVVALEPLLTTHGELLPLRLDRPPQPEDAAIRMYNPTKVLDALDESASQLMRFPSTGRIMRIIRYTFRPDPLEGVHVFKIPNLRASPTFVSEEVVRRWSAARLRGLQWREVWVGCHRA
jgi:hypothetical protein